MPATLLAVGALSLLLLPVDIPLGQISVVSASGIHIVEGDVWGEMMRLGLLFEFGLQLRQLLRMLLGQIDALGRIVVQVVEFPCAFIKGRIADYVFGFDIVGIRQLGLPSVVVDRPRTKDVVVLQRVTSGCLGVVNRVGQGRSFNRLLLDAANRFRGLDANKSSVVGRRSITWLYCVRMPPLSLMPFGQ